MQGLLRFVAPYTRYETLTDITEKKLQENLDSEIMQVILDEAQESYDENIVIELRSDNADEIEANVERMAQWVKNWISDHPDGV
jgi:adenylate kinase